MFMAAKKLNNSKCWALWDKDLRDRKNSTLRKLKRENSDLYYYYVFEQFIFFKQYLEVKRKINKAGIKIIGDIPIYLAYDSVEVWSNPKEFLLDENKGPKLISAVPPDSFSKEGQLWKNPVYDYDYMEKNNFRFWLKRIAGAAKMYDVIRIDHFRGIYSYYATKPNAVSAKRGKWYKGPGMKLIQAIKNKFPQKEFIAEDLGIIDEKVKTFRKQSGFSSTRVLQFAFESGNNEHLPQNYDDNCVAYTATHDNMTTMGFLQNSDNYVMKYIKNYCRIQSDDLDVILNDMITYLIASNAKTVIFPVQDLLHFGNDTRMNVPGKPDGNWVFRLTYEAWNSIDYSYFAWQNYVYSR